MDRFEPEKVSINLSSMHASTITPELAAQVRRVRKSGFTIAPEAGTQRMRDVINKNLDEEQILTACRLAFEAGWDHIKLYFMIGLPTETDADIDGMVDLAHGRSPSVGKREVRGKHAPVRYVTMSASSFIPKAGDAVPVGRDGPYRRISIASRSGSPAASGAAFGSSTTSARPATSRVCSRAATARSATCSRRAWRNGARFDGWGEHFNLESLEDKRSTRTASIPSSTRTPTSTLSGNCPGRSCIPGSTASGWRSS